MSSSWEVVEGHIKVFYDLRSPTQNESLKNLLLTTFIILVMVGFSIILTHSITEIALTPLERMLSVVRKRCGEIFKYTEELQEDDDRAECHDDQQADNDVLQIVLADAEDPKLVILIARVIAPDHADGFHASLDAVALERLLEGIADLRRCDGTAVDAIAVAPAFEWDQK